MLKYTKHVYFMQLLFKRIDLVGITHFKEEQRRTTPLSRINKVEFHSEFTYVQAYPRISIMHFPILKGLQS